MLQVLDRQERRVTHTPRVSPLPTDTVYTVMSNTTCEPGCGGCSRIATIYRRRLSFGKPQRAALAENAKRSLIAAESRSVRKPSVTKRRFQKAWSENKGKIAAIAAQLGVAENTVRALKKKHAITD